VGSAELVPTASIDGQRVPLAEAVLPLTDPVVLRGDGIFETLGVWGGRAFALEDHLGRLVRSLEAAGLAPVDLDRLRAEVAEVLDGVTADAALRLVVSASGRRIVLLDHPPQRPPLRRLVLVPAPWISPHSPLAGVKSLSYQPNMAALRAAQDAGADDALLHTPDGIVLEGTTFGVCWVVDGVVEAPALALGILDSISRRAVLELARETGHAVAEGHYTLDRLERASEVLLISSLRPLAAAVQVGDLRLPPSAPLCRRLAPLLEARRRG
jgi:branched-chain amino acid aminotransferase